MHDVSAVDGGYHLRCTGDEQIQLLPAHQLVDVRLVRRDGSHALASHFLVDVPHQTAVLSQEHFVFNGRQRISWSGVPDLMPGALLRTASAPLLGVHFSAVGDKFVRDLHEHRTPTGNEQAFGTTDASLSVPSTALLE